MKIRIAVIVTLGVLVFSSLAFGQNPGIQVVSSDPTGNGCGSNKIFLLVPAGTIYTCQNGVVAQASGGSTGMREIAFSMCANLNCQVGDTITVPRNISAATAGTLQKCSVRFGTAPTASTTIDVRKNGSGSPIATITAAAATANTTTFTVATLVENDYLTLVITAIGATPGKDANIICTVQ